MTSTLATHHGSALRVGVLRCRTEGGLYLREVFLRTQATGAIVEYGVLAVELAQFSAEARAAIEAGRTPLGAILHEFKLPFVSAPIGFFTVDAASLAGTPFALPPGAVAERALQPPCHPGRRHAGMDHGNPPARLRVKIVFLTAGTGSYYCGACMRDNALARELHRAGHEVTIAPMYLPLVLDEATLVNASDVPVFFGGINVFLQQNLALFRHTPAWLDRLLNGNGLLKWAARRSHMTSARTHGAMMLEMLNVDSGPFRKNSTSCSSGSPSSRAPISSASPTRCSPASPPS